MDTKIKVILVDDHAVVRAGFKMLLATCDDIDVIAEAERGEQVLQRLLQQTADVIVMDLSMPGLGGLETIRRIRQRHDRVKILVFSVHDEKVYVSRAIEAGADGYITKNSAPGILALALRQIMQGQSYIEPSLLDDSGTASGAPDYRAVIDAFSAREFDIFCLLAKGLTLHKVADELCLGYKTAANYSTRIKAKLNVSTLVELAHIAQLSGLVRDKI